MKLAINVVKMDWKIIISLPQSKLVKQPVSNRPVLRDSGMVTSSTTGYIGVIEITLNRLRPVSTDLLCTVF
jgi:hypothetical protein